MFEGVQGPETHLFIQRKGAMYTSLALWQATCDQHLYGHHQVELFYCFFFFPHSSTFIPSLINYLIIAFYIKKCWKINHVFKKVAVQRVKTFIFGKIKYKEYQLCRTFKEMWVTSGSQVIGSTSYLSLFSRRFKNVL